MIVGCHGDGLMNHLSAHSVRRAVALGRACRCYVSPYTHHLKVLLGRREAVILHALYEMAHNLGPGINSSFTDHL